MAAREKWLVTNLTAKNLGIGDLPRLPTLEPGQCLDLLRYHSKDQSQKSKILPCVIEKGWIGLTKIVDGQTTIVGPCDATEGTAPAYKPHVDAAISRLVARTLVSLDDAGVPGEIGFLDGAFYGFTGSEWVSLMPSWSNLTE